MKRFFIIDDDDMYQLILKRTIAKVSSEVSIQPFRNGAVAIDELTNLIAGNGILPDVILLDINMPVMDGWQFLQRFEELMANVTGKINVYMMSTSLDARDKERAISNKYVIEYLYKPISADTFREIIDKN